MKNFKQLCMAIVLSLGVCLLPSRGYGVEISKTTATKAYLVATYIKSADLNQFSELQAQIADKTLVNEEDAATWDALQTFDLGITVTTGDPWTAGTTRWDDGSDKIEGNILADDSVDEDAIDFTSVTLNDFSKDIATTDLTDTADVLYETELDIFSELQAQIADATVVDTTQINTAAKLDAIVADENLIVATEMDTEAELEALLTDMANIIQATEIDTFSEIQALVADKTLVNEEDAVTWDSAHTFSADVTISTDIDFTKDVSHILKVLDSGTDDNAGRSITIEAGDGGTGGSGDHDGGDVIWRTGHKQGSGSPGRIIADFQNKVSKYFLVTKDVGDTLPTIDTSTLLVVVDIDGSGTASILSKNTGTSILNFGDADDEDVGRISYSHSSDTFNFMSGTTGRTLLLNNGGQQNIKVKDQGTADQNGKGLLIKADDGGTGGSGDHHGGNLTLQAGSKQGSGNDGSVLMPTLTNCPNMETDGSGTLSCNSTDYLEESELDSESELETQIADMGNIIQETEIDSVAKFNAIISDGALDDDDVSDDEEAIEDFVGGMLGGTETFVDVAYQDSTGDIDFVVPVKDEDNFVSDSDVFLATQQSIKAYADLHAKLAGVSGGQTIYGDTAANGDLTLKATAASGANEAGTVIFDTDGTTNQNLVEVKLNGVDAFIIDSTGDISKFGGISNTFIGSAVLRVNAADAKVMNNSNRGHFAFNQYTSDTTGRLSLSLGASVYPLYHKMYLDYDDVVALENLQVAVGDTEVDCDGDATTGAGACRSAASNSLVLQGATLSPMGDDTVDWDDGDDADGVYLCTDSLTSPAHVRVDLDQDCTNNSSTDGTYILGSTAAAVKVTSAWAFIDEDADTFLDDGEDLYIDLGKPLVWYSSGTGDAFVHNDLNVLGSISSGATQWDDGSNKIEGNILADDSVDEDAMDFTSITLNDFTKDIATTDLTDTADVLYETELDIFSEIQTQISDKTLVNEEDAVTWDALGTFALGVTITTGDPFTLGAVRWDDGSDKMEGDNLADDSVDEDAMDFTSITLNDFTKDIATTDLTDTADVLYEAELDAFSELQTQIVGKTLVNEEDAVTWDSAHTFSAGISVTGDADVSGVFKVDSTQVVKEQQVHIADAPGDTTANNATTINAILAMLEAHGLVASA